MLLGHYQRFRLNGNMCLSLYASLLGDIFMLPYALETP